MKKIKLTFVNKWLILFIILFGVLIRFFWIGSVPSRLTIDELSIGYNAYSILKTGTDEWGERLPLTFKAFGDYKQPLYIYAVVPMIKLFDLSPMAIRIPSVIAGSLLILGVYWLTKEIFKRESVSLWAAGVMAITPWAVKLSRVGFESNLSLCLFVFGLLFLIKSLKTKNRKQAMLSGLLFGLTFYTYIAFRLIVGLLAIYLLGLIIKAKDLRKSILIMIAALVITLLPIASHLIDVSGQARFSQVSIFSDVGIQAQVMERRNYCFLQDPTTLSKVCQLFFNKYQVTFYKIVENYFQFFSPNFLFISGDRSETYNPQVFGEILPILAPAYLVGIWLIIKKKGVKPGILKAVMLISPAASALVGYPQILRGSSLLPMVVIVIALGLDKIMSWLKKIPFRTFIISGVIALLVFSFAHYYLYYFFVYPVKSANAFYQIDKSMSDVLKDKETDVDRIYFRKKFSESHTFLAFYQKWDPVWFQKNVEYSAPDGFGFERPKKVGKYEFGDKLISEIICSGDEEKVLYVTDHLDEKNMYIQPIYSLYDFSQVHVQVEVYDVSSIRTTLGKMLPQYCSSGL